MLGFHLTPLIRIQCTQAKDFNVAGMARSRLSFTVSSVLMESTCQDPQSLCPAHHMCPSTHAVPHRVTTCHSYPLGTGKPHAGMWGRGLNPEPR